MSGYAADPGDCDDSNPNVHPGAVEICNYIDDNCDGRIDERVRPRCGVGWCERESYSCEPRDCVPGERSERCTGFDDDCNGLVDDGDLCDTGKLCIGGQCLVTPAGDSETTSPETPESFDMDQPTAPPPIDTEAPGRRGCSWGLVGGGVSPWFFAGLGALLWRSRRRDVVKRGATKG